LPAPGSVLTLAERPTLPVFLALSMPKEATPWTILSWGSTLLHGMSRSLRPRPLDLRAPLLGFLAPPALWEKGVHVPPVSRRASRSCRGLCQRVPPRRLRCRSQVFPTSQRPSSSLRRPAVFRQVALLGFRPSGACSARAAPTARRRRHALLTFLPDGWPSPHPRRGYLGARQPET
jgi:hypothetical protein